jgi:hypothetical protein
VVSRNVGETAFLVRFLEVRDTHVSENGKHERTQYEAEGEFHHGRFASSITFPAMRSGMLTWPGGT